MPFPPAPILLAPLQAPVQVQASLGLVLALEGGMGACLPIPGSLPRGRAPCSDPTEVLALPCAPCCLLLCL